MFSRGKQTKDEKTVLTPSVSNVPNYDTEGVSVASFVDALLNADPEVALHFKTMML